MSKGIVTSNPTLSGTQMGKISIVKADNYEEFKLGKNDLIEYENKTGEVLQVDDTVEFNIISTTKCEFTKRYVASQGIMVGESNIKIRITQLESDTYGLTVGSIITLDTHPDKDGKLPDPASPTPAKSGDTVEFMLFNSSGGVFVKVIKKA